MKLIVLTEILRRLVLLTLWFVAGSAPLLVIAPIYRHIKGKGEHRGHRGLEAPVCCWHASGRLRLPPDLKLAVGGVSSSPAGTINKINNQIHLSAKNLGLTYHP